MGNLDETEIAIWGKDFSSSPAHSEIWPSPTTGSFVPMPLPIFDSYLHSRRLRIGELLLQKGVITSDQLQAALAAQKLSRAPLGRVLVERGDITETALRWVLWEQSLRNAIAAGFLAASALTASLPQIAQAQTVNPRACQPTDVARNGAFQPAAQSVGRPTFPRLGWVSIRQGNIRPELRQHPRATESRILAHLRPGNVVTLLGTSDDREWYLALANNRCGYIAASRIDLFDPADTNKDLDAEIDPAEHPSARTPLTGFSHPLGGTGYLSQGPGGTTHGGRAHFALDFAVEMGSPVYAMRSGRVIAVEDRYPDNGGGREAIHYTNYVWLEHEGGIRSAYVHLQQGFIRAVGIEAGDRVEAGELIGYSGNSGFSTAPHLHVEVQDPTPRGAFGRTLPFTIDRIETLAGSVEQELSAIGSGTP